GGQGYVSPELQAQIEEGRKLARQDAREHPAEHREPVQQHEAQAPAPKPAPTVTHRTSRIRRAIGALLGGNNKPDSGT
ncbi:MAG TPA: hypothetical protein VGF58_14820, partial [Burkholderiales bacterium]